MAAVVASLGCIGLFAGTAQAQEPGVYPVPAVLDATGVNTGDAIPDCAACDSLDGSVQELAGLGGISAGDNAAGLTATHRCYFTTRGDYVHRTGGDASGHGWWENINCPVLQADVRIWLQQYYSDGSWRTRGSTGYKRVYSGGGSANRANARAGCDSSAVTSWRSVVDVDLVGLSDSSEKLITNTRNISCRDY